MPYTPLKTKEVTLPRRKVAKDVVAAAHAAGLSVYIDTVFNHKGGADATEVVTATPVSNDNRNIEIGPSREIEAWTMFTFPGRGSTHSPVQWRVRHFDAVDYDQRTGERTIFRLREKSFQNAGRPGARQLRLPDVRRPGYGRGRGHRGTLGVGTWIMATLDVDGFRFDAAKHIRFFFFNDWLDRVRALVPAGRSLFAVGEYYSGSVATLRWFIAQTGRRMSLFDFPLQFNFRIASQSGGTFDMRTIFNGTLVAEDPDMAVTFVDNHDTFQADRHDAAVADGFRALAYAMILLRAGGTPCLFYPDHPGERRPRPATAAARQPDRGAARFRLRRADGLL